MKPTVPFGFDPTKIMATRLRNNNMKKKIKLPKNKKLVRTQAGLCSECVGYES